MKKLLTTSLVLCSLLLNSGQAFTYRLTNNTESSDQFLDVTWQNLTDHGRPQRTADYATITATDCVRFNVMTKGQATPGQSWHYRWDFDGDGAWDTPFSPHTTAQYTFNQVGNFITRIEAQAVGRNAVTPLQHFLPVYVERNRLPQGDFKAYQDTNFVGERVTYTVQVNDPESSQQVEVRFDSDGDGIWDSPFRRQLSWWWVYDTPGDYTVKMQLRDPQGRVNYVQKNVTISPMIKPEAKVMVSNRTQAENLAVTLDGSHSLGRQLTYQWQVLQHPKIRLPNSPKVSLRLPAGEYQVLLTVRDRLGAPDQVQFPVTFTSKPLTPTHSYQSGLEKSPNILQFLPGAPSIDKNFVIPPGGVPEVVSPFVIEAGTAIPQDGFVSGMRAGR